MLAWILALGIGLALAAVTYGRRAPLAIVALRGLAATCIAALLLDAPLAPSRPLWPWVALDVSQSWADSARWQRAAAAADSARRAGGDSLLLVGATLRAGPAPAWPADTASRIGPLVEAARAAGRPVVLVTDGRIADAERADALPRGSVVVVPPARDLPDIAIAALDAPRAAVIGDTIDVRVRLRSSSASGAARTLSLSLGGRVLAREAIGALEPDAEQEAAFRLPVPALEGEQPLVLALDRGDAIAANDSAVATLSIAGTASIALVSTAPDQDARFALAVLRATQRGAVRAYWRVAPGQWREGDALRAVPEDAVRRAVEQASFVVLHGDTAYFGAPRVRARAALVLMVPPDAPDEHYAMAAGDSPLRAALTDLPWEQLPPLRAGASPRGNVLPALVARRARRTDERAVVALVDGERRVAIVPASGFWRWRLRGGRPGDAFDALWGSIFDWVATSRVAGTAASPPRIATELVPTPVTLRSGPVGSAAARDLAPRARGAWWLAAIALLALCGEWVMRRRIGWR